MADENGMKVWAVQSGLFDKYSNKEVVERCIVDKLIKLNVPVEGGSPRETLLKHIFNRAYNSASEEQKRTIHSLAHQQASLIYESYSKAKKTAIKASVLFAQVVSHPIVQFTASVFFVWSLYLLLGQAAAALSYSAKLYLPGAIVFAAEYLPPAVFALGVQVELAARWVIQHQLRIALAEIAVTALIPEMVEPITNAVFSVLGFPTKVSWFFFAYPFEQFANFYTRSAAIAALVDQRANRSLQNHEEEEQRQNRLLREGSLQVWLAAN